MFSLHYVTRLHWGIVCLSMSNTSCVGNNRSLPNDDWSETCMYFDKHPHACLYFVQLIASVKPIIITITFRTPFDVIKGWIERGRQKMKVFIFRHVERCSSQSATSIVRAAALARWTAQRSPWQPPALWRFVDLRLRDNTQISTVQQYENFPHN
jgi:hypothetical protein